MELAGITEEQVQEAVKRINHRPRKALGFRAPHEAFFGWNYATPSNHWLLHFEFESAFMRLKRIAYLLFIVVVLLCGSHRYM